MGCVSSAVVSCEIPSEWLAVTVNTKTGYISATPTNGGAVLAKYTLDHLPAYRIARRNQFVDQKIGGVWEETKLGGEENFKMLGWHIGKVTFKCLDRASLDAMWKEMPAEPFLSERSEDTANKWTQVGLLPTLSVPSSAGLQHHVGGIAEWQDKVFLMQGVINDKVIVVEKSTGEVVLSLQQSSCGKCLKFYDTDLPRKRNSLSRRSKEQQAIEDKAYCGTRNTNDALEDDLNLFVRPTTLEKIPISLFAMAAMYSSFTLNDMDVD